ncbi:hypothetical protein [Paenibacillus sp. GbtcB18]|uniref:hypothetical protein n=1 Tax=Paenibacillus sp. GbtcB18 TaxID=2824763 RepID=UPI001C2FF5F7|nr:hypothetical protein [Paenibacillus sp. GbtcB18]
MLRGYRIIENENMVERKQIRTHRKRRINKKWAKRYGFNVIPKKGIFVMGSTLIMHPTVAQIVRQQVGAV